MKSDRGNREWLNDYMSLKQVNPENPFTVPEGYFDELSGRIESYIKIDELRDGSPEQGFAVPENYFDELTNNITARISIEEALDREATGFNVPEGYFDNLGQQIQGRIFLEETLNEQPEGFTVPEGYFDKLTQNILLKTAVEEKAQRRGVVRRLFATTAFKYASAACLVLAVGATLLLTQNNGNAVQNHNNTFLHKSLAAIPVDDIQSYLQLHLDATDTRGLIDESKQVDADNLTNELQDALDSTSQ